MTNSQIGNKRQAKLDKKQMEQSMNKMFSLGPAGPDLNAMGQR